MSDETNNQDEIDSLIDGEVINEEDLQIDSEEDCKESILLNKTCKYFHHDPYYTPNNYDIYFNYHNIPRNIHIEKPHELRKRLQRTMPLSKIIHLNLDTDSFPQQNRIHIWSSINLKYTEKLNINNRTITREINKKIK